MSDQIELKEIKENNEKKENGEIKDNNSNNKDSKNNAEYHIEKLFEENIIKMKSVWEKEKNNFGYYYQKELNSFIKTILSYPCIIQYKDNIKRIFKFFCKYFNFLKDKLNEIPVHPMFIIIWLFSNKVNIFSLNPKINYFDINDKNILIEEQFFVDILKEIEPNMEIIKSNYECNYYNYMHKYLLEYLVYIGFYENFLNIFLGRNDIEPYSYICFCEYIFYCLNFCGNKKILEKNNYKCNFDIIDNFIKKMKFYLDYSEDYYSQNKENKDKYFNFIKHISKKFDLIIYGGLGSTLPIVENLAVSDDKKNLENKINDYIYSIFSFFEYLLNQKKLEVKILSLENLTIIINKIKSYDESLEKKFNFPKKVYEYIFPKVITFFQKINFFDIIFGENIHEALIERCHDIIIFLYQNKIFTKKNISLIYKICESKSQSINTSIITFFSNLMPVLSNDDVDFILDDINNKNLRDITEENLKLLENFFLNENYKNDKVLNLLKKFSNEMYFYEGININIINKSRNILIKLLFNKKYTDDLIECINNCIYNLKNNYLLNTSRNLLFAIINEFNKKENESSIKEIFKAIHYNINNFKDFINFLDYKFNFFQILIKNLAFIKNFLIKYKNNDNNIDINVDLNIYNNIKENNFNFIPKNLKDIENYYDLVLIEEYKKFLEKDNIFNNEKEKLLEKEIMVNILTKFEFEFEKNTYDKILSKIIDTILSYHEFGNFYINDNIIKSLYELLLTNNSYEKEKEIFYEFLKNILVFQNDNNSSIKLLTKNSIYELSKILIPNNDISSFPYPAYEALNLYIIYINNSPNNNIIYSFDENKFILIKKLNEVKYFEYILDYYLLNNDIKIALNALINLTNIIEVSCNNIYNRKYLLNKLFILLEKHKKNNKTAVRRILRLISIVNKSKVNEGFLDINDSTNFLSLNINNDFLNNNKEDNIQTIKVFKGITVKEFKNKIINEILCRNDNDLYMYNYTYHTYHLSLEGLKNFIKAYDLIMLYYNDQILKNEFTLAEYNLKDGECLLLLNRCTIDWSEENFTMNEAQLKNGYEQIKVVFGEKYDENFMKEAMYKHKGDIQNTIIFLTDENEVNKLKKEIEDKNENEPKKREEMICMEENEFNILLDILNENDSELNDTIWDLFSEIKFKEQFIINSITKDFEKIFDEKNVNKNILILKIINSIIFDDKNFCKNNTIDYDFKNKWISKAIQDEKSIKNIFSFFSQAKADSISDNNYFILNSLFLNIFNQILSIIAKKNTDISEENKKIIIEEKDTKIYLEILSKNNIIIYLYKLLSNIIEISKDEFNLTKNIIISNIYIIILNYLEIINSKEEIEKLLNLEKNEKKLLNILISEKEEDIRKKSLDFLKSLIDKENKDTFEIILDLYYSYLISDELYFEQFYELYNYLFNQKEIKAEIINIKEIISKFFENIFFFSQRNVAKKDINIDKAIKKIKNNIYILCSFSPLYNDIIKSEIEEKLNENKNIVMILYNLVFDYKNNNFIFNDDTLKENIFKLLSNIISLDFKYFNIISSRIFSNHNNVVLKKFDLPLNYSLRDLNKKKYLGLKNFGSTCYINALFQQLFMIPTFFIDIFKNFDFFNKFSSTKLSQITLFEIQIAFANLLKSIMYYYPPFNFIKTFKSAFNEEPIKLNVQQDTHEFLSILCEKIEKEAKIFFNKENFLENSFKGILTNEIISLESEYPYNSKTEEPFYSLTLDIKNFNNLEDALNAYIKEEILDGENKFFVEKYGKKIRIKKRNSLKRIGNELIIHLKRFEFDFNTFINNKLNDYLKFPLVLNLKKYLSEEKKKLNNDKNMEYILTGILIHTGNNLQFGHYYSLIKTYNNNTDSYVWYKFNDIDINEIDINKELESNYYTNAYLLFYTQKEIFEKYKNFDKNSIINDKLNSIIHKQNINFLEIKAYSNIIYHKFFLNYLKNSKKYQKNEKKDENRITNIEKLMNQNLERKIKISEKIINFYKNEKNVIIELNDIKASSLPNDINDVYFNIINDDRNIDLDKKINEINNEENSDKIFNLFCKYFFGIVLQYNDNEESLKDCIEFFIENIEENPLLVINAMNIIEQKEENIEILLNILFKYSSQEENKYIRKIFEIIFQSLYNIETNLYNIFTTEYYIYLTEDLNGNIIIKKQYKSLFLRLFKSIFCDNLEKSRINYQKNNLFLNLYYTITISYFPSIYVSKDYILNLVSFISNNSLDEFKSESNPDIKMDNSNINNLYLDIFSEIILRCVTPSMLIVNKISPYYIFDEKNIKNFENNPILPKNFEKILEKNFLFYYILNRNNNTNSIKMICHICWENELISRKILSIFNSFLRVNYYEYPLIEDVFFNTIKLFDIKDSFIDIRLDTLFEFNNDEKNLIKFYNDNKYKNYGLVTEGLFLLSKAIDKYNIIFEYLKKYKNNLMWIKEYYIEFFDDKFNLSFLLSKHPDAFAVIEAQIINKLEL